MKTEQIILKATKEFKQKVKRMAIRDNLNMSEYITNCILKDFEKREENGKNVD